MHPVYWILFQAVLLYYRTVTVVVHHCRDIRLSVRTEFHQTNGAAPRRMDFVFGRRSCDHPRAALVSETSEPLHTLYHVKISKVPDTLARSDGFSFPPSYEAGGSIFHLHFTDKYSCWIAIVNPDSWTLVYSTGATRTSSKLLEVCVHT